MRSFLAPEFRWPRLKALFGARAIQQAYANASWRKLDLLEGTLRQAFDDIQPELIIEQLEIEEFNNVH